jgi:hypothetical protein
VEELRRHLENERNEDSAVRDSVDSATTRLTANRFYIDKALGVLLTRPKEKPTTLICRTFLDD